MGPDEADQGLGGVATGQAGEQLQRGAAGFGVIAGEEFDHDGHVIRPGPGRRRPHEDAPGRSPPLRRGLGRRTEDADPVLGGEARPAHRHQLLLRARPGLGVGASEAFDQLPDPDPADRRGRRVDRPGLLVINPPAAQRGEGRRQ